MQNIFIVPAMQHGRHAKPLFRVFKFWQFIMFAHALNIEGLLKKIVIERFHSRDQRPYLFNETKERFCITIEFNSHRTDLVHQYGLLFIV